MWTSWALDFNLTNNFIRISNFNYSFVDVEVNASFHNSHKLLEVANNSKLDINGSNKNFSFLFLTRSFFHLIIKKNPDVKIKIIPLPIFFFIGYSIKHLQPTKPHQGINVYSSSQFLTIELINKFESLCTCQLHHSHKKRKDSLETRAEPAVFSL